MRKITRSAREERMASSNSEVTNPQKITFGEMRASGVRDVLIYCRDHRCSHHADGWADDVRHDGLPAGRSSMIRTAE